MDDTSKSDIQEATEPNPKAAERTRSPIAFIAYCGFLFLLMAFAEGGARVLSSTIDDPGLRRILYDYGRLSGGDPQDFRFAPDPILPYRLKPGFEFTSPDGFQKTRHNSDGFRGEDFPPKSERTLRILCLGGSTTYGVSVVDDATTYPAELSRLLNNRLESTTWENFEVFNMGVGGYTSREVLTTLIEHGLRLYPDVVVIQSGVNDVAPRFYPEFQSDYSHFRKRLEPFNTSFAARMAYRSHLFLMMGWKLGYLTPLTLQSLSQYPLPPAAGFAANMESNDTTAYRNNLSQIIDSAEAADVRIWLLTQAHMFGGGNESPNEEMRIMDESYLRGLKEHNNLIHDLAVSKSIGLVDLEKAMPIRRSYFRDPIHMTEEGNRVKARIIADTIGKELQSLDTP